MTEFYRHTVNGKHYDSRGVDGASTLDDYKRIVREAYGNLRGVRFQTIPLGDDYECGHCGEMFTSDAYRAHLGY